MDQQTDRRTDKKPLIEMLCATKNHYRLKAAIPLESNHFLVASNGIVIILILLCQEMRRVLSQADVSVRRRESYFVNQVLDAIDNRPSDDMQKGVSILAKDLPKDCEWILDHFGIIREIFANRLFMFSICC